MKCLILRRINGMKRDQKYSNSSINLLLMRDLKDLLRKEAQKNLRDSMKMDSKTRK